MEWDALSDINQQMQDTGEEEHHEDVGIPLQERGPRESEDIARDEIAHGCKRLAQDLVPEVSVEVF